MAGAFSIGGSNIIKTVSNGSTPVAPIPGQRNVAPLDPRLPVTFLNGVAYNYAGQPVGQYAEGGGAAGGGGGGGGYAAPVKSQAQIEAEARSARAAALKPGVQDKVNSILGIYDSLYGDVDAVVGDKSAQIAERHQAEVGSLTNQFNAEFPKIGNAYGSRGTYDSSYRIDSEEGAKNAFGAGVGELGRGMRDDLSTVGQWGGEKKAKFGADKGNLQALLEQAMKSENPDELQDTMNKLITTWNDVNASKASYRSRGSYLNELNASVPQSQRSAGLSANLGNVLKSSIPGALKRSIGQQIIANSGLTPAEQEQLLSEFSGQVSAEEDKLTPTAVAA